MKLISMTDFVLQENKGGQQINSITSQLHQELRRIKKYANFLKQPLKLEMFVPCDVDGNPFNRKEILGQVMDGTNSWSEYEQAEERVLFEDFEIATNKEGEKVVLGDYTCFKFSDLENGTIEDLVKYVHIKLTPNAIKSIFG